MVLKERYLMTVEEQGGPGKAPVPRSDALGSVGNAPSSSSAWVGGFGSHLVHSTLFQLVIDWSV